MQDGQGSYHDDRDMACVHERLKAENTFDETCLGFQANPHTRGNAGDSPELIAHIKVLKKLKANIDEYLLDGAYDSYENHADIWYHLDGATPRIYCGEDAVSNPEGTIKRINHWVNKMWKLGGSIRMPIKEKLKFLYELGRTEQVGAYFRNQNLDDVT